MTAVVIVSVMTAVSATTLTRVHARRTVRAQVLARVAHEMRGALTGIELCTSSLERDGCTTPRLHDSVCAIRAQLERGTWAVEDLEDIRNRKPRPRNCSEPVDLFGLVQRRARAWARLANLCDASFKVDWRAGHAHVAADPRRLCQALDNLVSNAIRHGGGQILVTALLGSGRVRLEIRDGGQGLPRCADLTTGSSPSRRHGHGLSIAGTAIESSGGQLGLLDDGISVELPIYAARAAAVPSPSDAISPGAATPA